MTTSRIDPAGETESCTREVRDPAYTRVVLVTLPEATPVHEAEQLQEDLRRAGIEPFAWVVNQSFIGVPTRDPVLGRRGALEHPYLQDVVHRLATRHAIATWRPAAPVGREGLLELAASGAASSMSR